VVAPPGVAAGECVGYLLVLVVEGSSGLLFPVGGVGIDRTVGQIDAVDDVQLRAQPAGQVRRDR